MPYLGELAAILAALCWTINSLSLERLGKPYSPWALNMLTKSGGLVAVSLLALALSGHLLPQATARQWGLLLLSGFLGFSLGDGFLYAGFQTIGALRTLLIFSANPVLAALFAWVFLGEALRPLHILGILLAVAGIMWVIRADLAGKATVDGKIDSGAAPTVSIKGLAAAGLATLGQAAGALLSKAGMESLEAVPAAQIRLIGGVLGMGLLLSLLRKWRTLPPVTKEKRGQQALFISIVLGTLVGMVLSMMAIKQSQVAVASILMSLMPVMILPVSAIFLKVRVRPREVFGAGLTLVGVAMLFL